MGCRQDDDTELWQVDTEELVYEHRSCDGRLLCWRGRRLSRCDDGFIAAAQRPT